MRKTKKTVVINLFAGAGAGKSTLAAGLYSELKMRGLSVELVREYIKKWAWENRVPGKFDQIYIFGHQAREEGMLYGKLDFLITDSPLLLVPFFEELLVKKQIIEPAVFNFIKHAEDNGVEYLNFWVPRPERYETEGRYHTEEEAKVLDKQLFDWLVSKGLNIVELPVNHKDRLKVILDAIGHEDTKKFND